MLRQLFVALNVSLLLGLPSVAAAQAVHEVVGKGGPNRWDYNGTVSTPATIGKPENRLQVPVRNGETVLFRIATGTHDVLFENAKPELEQGLWEIKDQSGSLYDLPTDKFPHFDHAKAQSTKKGMGELIQIRIKNLKPGLANGVLFACNPHSESPDGTGVSMLGVIVLKEDGQPNAAEMLRAFYALPKSETCRIIDFQKAEIRPGIVNNTYVLIVTGTKPCLNMEVRLVPYVYVQQPEYWGIEVVGCLPGGICLPATAQYAVAIPLDGVTGTKGIEVIGAIKREKIEIPPRSSTKRQ